MANTQKNDPRAVALKEAHDKGNRVRVLIGERKMKIPGAVVLTEDGEFQVKANWGRTYDVPTDDSLKELEIADGSGRYQPLAA